MIEICKNSEYEYYQISNTGNVRSLDHYGNVRGGGKALRKGKLLKLNPDKQGYLGFALIINNKRKRVQVHREVAKLFVDVPEHLKHIPIDQLQVDHYNENKSDNRACNLHWVTSKENANRGTRNERSNKARGYKIIQLTLDNQFVNEFYSLGQAEKETGIWKSNISNCIQGKYNQTGGYKWVKI